MLLVATASLAIHGCSDRTVGSTFGADASTATLDARCGPTKPSGPPLQHRASAVACGLSAPYPPTSACTSDAGCGTIPFAQACLPYPDAGEATFCNDDQCFTDDDCPNGPCGCSRSLRQAGTLNFCYAGNCHTDADCGAGGYCSPSVDTNSCFRGAADASSYFCHTAKDECTNDSDCTSCGATAFCAMSLAGFWQCIQPSQGTVCPPG